MLKSIATPFKAASLLVDILQVGLLGEKKNNLLHYSFMSYELPGEKRKGFHKLKKGEIITLIDEGKEDTDISFEFGHLKSEKVIKGRKGFVLEKINTSSSSHIFYIRSTTGHGCFKPGETIELVSKPDTFDIKHFFVSTTDRKKSIVMFEKEMKSYYHDDTLAFLDEERNRKIDQDQERLKVIKGAYTYFIVNNQESKVKSDDVFQKEETHQNIQIGTESITNIIIGNFFYIDSKEMQVSKDNQNTSSMNTKSILSAKCLGVCIPSSDRSQTQRDQYEELLKKRYRELAIMYHPDKEAQQKKESIDDSISNEKKFQSVTQAYETLGDRIKVMKEKKQK